MILALDIGNTNITIGVFDEEKLLFVSRLATDCSRLEDQYAIELQNILELYGICIKNIEGAVISSVVPPVTSSIMIAIKRLTNVDPICVGSKTKTNIKIDKERKEMVGADLIVGCVAAGKKYDGPCIILDMGTATTFVVLDKNKKMIGGAIAPGVGVSTNALIRRTSQLPSISIQPPKHVIGENTIECMCSGILLGTACMIDGMIERMEEELGEKCNIIATGGLSKEIIPLCKHEICFCDTLLLQGLKIIYDDNK